MASRSTNLDSKSFIVRSRSAARLCVDGKSSKTAFDELALPLPKKWGVSPLDDHELGVFGVDPAFELWLLD